MRIAARLTTSGIESNASSEAFDFDYFMTFPGDQWLSARGCARPCAEFAPAEAKSGD